jgi:hypothetical protein
VVKSIFLKEGMYKSIAVIVAGQMHLLKEIKALG